MSVRLAIFDFDGTLADTYPLFAEVLNGLARKHGFREVAEAERPRLRRLSAQDVLRELQLPLWKVPAVLADFRAIMQSRIGEVRLFPGIDEVLHQMLDARVDVAVTTSNSSANVQAVLGAALMQRLTAVECGVALFGKAHRLRRVVKTTQVAKDQIIYIGDEIRDAVAAARAGVSFGAVAWGYTDLDALLSSSPRKVFRHSADMLTLSVGEGAARA
ncbi:HAD hydrolase-like protein [Cupriavidus pampae]|uniref:Phosphoglycolate phosphatase n=1 Tax=Cupriavidus pampae TaxID=659251 RepID=A0ABM8WBN5_9BURK|nr:HAD hydrolase-like protein [Cupriavidus pampae]CAG9164473.1 Phosphoglycolate phosphatase [Cupriavidus pampae]